MLIFRLFLYLVSFFIIWYGAGLVVSVVDRLARRLNLSSFAVSFFVLGILTSLPEATVGISAIIDKKPEIFVGNLLGGSLLLFIFVIPVLAVLGGGIKLAHQLDNKKLFFSLLVTAAPVFLVVDRQISLYEGLFLIFIYGYLFYSIEKRKGLLERVKDQLLNHKGSVSVEILKLFFGVLIIFLSSKFIVDQTIYFSSVFRISSFLISLLFLSIGTNLPELSLAVRAVFLGKKEVAFGDYIGSAAANTLIFGILTILNGGEILLADGFLKILLFTIFGLALFFYFSRSKNDISRYEGTILLLFYFLFFLTEILTA